MFGNIFTQIGDTSNDMKHIFNIMATNQYIFHILISNWSLYKYPAQHIFTETDGFSKKEKAEPDTIVKQF